MGVSFLSDRWLPTLKPFLDTDSTDYTVFALREGQDLKTS